MKLHLKCTDQLHIEKEFVDNVTFDESESYYAEGQSIDRRAWYIYDDNTNQYCYAWKFHFDIVVTEYVLHPHFNEFHLPVVGRDSKNYLCLTPSGFVNTFHSDDVQVFQYKVPQYIPSDEARFR